MDKSLDKYLEVLLKQLVDTIVMNQDYSTLRIPDSLEVLEWVRDMDMLRDQS